MHGRAVLMCIVLAAPAFAGELALREAAVRHGLPPALVEAVVAVESAGDPRAVSRKGAMGLMQLMPATAARFGVADPFDGRQSLEGGCAYLRWLLDRFDGSIALALAGYNAGEGAVEKHGGIPPFVETEEYVRRVMARLGVVPALAVRPAATSVLSLAPAGVASSIVAGAGR